MRIGFDFRPALRQNSRRRGIGRYTFELARALLDADRKHEFLLYVTREEAPLPAGKYVTRQVPSLRRPSRLNWLVDLLMLPRRIRKDQIDLFHATEMISFSPPSSCPVWITIHDLIPYIFWDETVRRVPRDFAYALRRTWRQAQLADCIITDSIHSKRDICERMGIASERVAVVPLGSSEELVPVEKEPAWQCLQRKFHLDAPYLFYVGGSDFRKNLNFLVEAFAQIRDGGYEGKLVLGGETFLWDIPEVADLKELISRLKLDDSVVFPGYLPDEDLSCFYSACDFFVFPSLYEGFGLPVLEAMKCGAPLLISNRSSIPEVAGEAALYFDPEDSEELVSAFGNAVENPEMVQSRVEEGFKRSTMFTWSAAASAIHSLYERCGA